MLSIALNVRHGVLRPGCEDERGLFHGVPRHAQPTCNFGNRHPSLS